MKYLKSCILISVAIPYLTSALAQDCITPIPIRSSKLGYTGDTCTAGNPLPTYGGVGSPQNEIIYSLIGGRKGIVSIAATGGYQGTTPAVFLLPDCSPSTDPIAFGAPGADMIFINTTIGHTYYVVATADPGGPNAGCGQYSLDYIGTPVTLQEFRID